MCYIYISLIIVLVLLHDCFLYAPGVGAMFQLFSILFPLIDCTIVCLPVLISVMRIIIHYTKNRLKTYSFDQNLMRLHACRQRHRTCNDRRERVQTPNARYVARLMCILISPAYPPTQFARLQWRSQQGVRTIFDWRRPKRRTPCRPLAFICERPSQIAYKYNVNVTITFVKWLK